MMIKAFLMTGNIIFLWCTPLKRNYYNLNREVIDKSFIVRLSFENFHYEENPCINIVANRS